MKKNTAGMDFEAYSERLATLHEYCFDSKSKKVEQDRFQIISNSMQMKYVKKTQFAGLNDKSFYFLDGIVSLPFGHFLLKKVREEKEKHRADLHTKISKIMYEFLALEGHVHLCDRLRVLRSINAQPPLHYLLNSQVAADKKLKINKRVDHKWKLEKSQFTMDSLVEIF